MWWLNMFSSTGGDSVCAYAEGICTDREAVGCTALYPPARAWLSHLEAHTYTHTALFCWLGPAQHIVSITLLLWPLSRAVSSDCRQIEPLHPLPHGHAHIPLFHPHLLQILLFPHIFLVNTGLRLHRNVPYQNKNILYTLFMQNISFFVGKFQSFKHSMNNHIYFFIYNI